MDDGEVVVGVRVDEPGCEHEPVEVDDRGALGCEVGADGSDDAGDDGDVGHESRCTGAVDDAGAPQDEWGRGRVHVGTVVTPPTTVTPGRAGVDRGRARR